MKRLLALTLVLPLLLCSGCGKDTHEKLATQALAKMKEMNALLESVKDEASAKAASGKLKSLVAELEDLKKRQEKLPAPTDAEKKAMEAKFGESMELQQKFVGNMLRVMTDEKMRAQLADLEKEMGKMK